MMGRMDGPARAAGPAGLDPVSFSEGAPEPEAKPTEAIPPVALRLGDLVEVVAPSGPVAPARLRAGVAWLAERYRVRVRPEVLDRQGYLAGSDEARAEALDRALADPDVRAVFAARGGFGLTRILGRLRPDLLRSDPKPIIGFSDITALLAWANHAGVVAFHGPVVTQLGALTDADRAHLVALLEDPDAELTLRGASPGDRRSSRASGARGAGAEAAVASGTLRGGNLTVLGALAGTRWQPPLGGALLLVEDVGEPPYRLDRVATQLLSQVAPFSAAAAAGVGIGALTGCTGEPGSAPPSLVLAERLGVGRSLVVGLPFGHGTCHRAWPVGHPAEIDPARGRVRWRGAVQRA